MKDESLPDCVSDRKIHAHNTPDELAKAAASLIHVPATGQRVGCVLTTKEEKLIFVGFCDDATPESPPVHTLTIPQAENLVDVLQRVIAKAGTLAKGKITTKEF